MNKISRKANKKKLKRKRFEKLKKGGTISVEIDELTSCLKRIRDGKIVKTYFVNGLPSEEHLLEREFDWQVEIENGFEVK